MAGKDVLDVDVSELGRRLTHYLELAGRGTVVRIVEKGTVVAELTSPRCDELQPRQPGRLKGKIWMAADFDEWPEDILATFEASPYPQETD